MSLKPLRFTPGSPEVVYTGKGSHDTPEPSEKEKISSHLLVQRHDLDFSNADLALGIMLLVGEVSFLERQGKVEILI